MPWKPAEAWTSLAPRAGRRHFRVVLQGGRGAERWVELASLLDPQVRLRESWNLLQDKTQWQSGWQPIACEDSDVI
ncbi:TIGR02450 family Trp-rich protein [Synechococcus sp. BIOS-E4-1]|uniref:TIGR02450 family Trp-rich protein n=1 Tax=Synechococcus sp. BIOS-E4-1 TaxID=1400864 RepID=UPI0016492B69|nr:TIGR02450 family Trp-rich protein [Synechococcus sp. BIOS-E4-1]